MTYNEIIEMSYDDLDETCARLKFKALICLANKIVDKRNEVVKNCLEWDMEAKSRRAGSKARINAETEKYAATVEAEDLKDKYEIVVEKIAIRTLKALGITDESDMHFYKNDFIIMAAVSDPYVAGGEKLMKFSENGIRKLLAIKPKIQRLVRRRVRFFSGNGNESVIPDIQVGSVGKKQAPVIDYEPGDDYRC